MQTAKRRMATYDALTLRDAVEHATASSSSSSSSASTSTSSTALAVTTTTAAAHSSFDPAFTRDTLAVVSHALVRCMLCRMSVSAATHTLCPEFDFRCHCRRRRSTGRSRRTCTTRRSSTSARQTSSPTCARAHAAVSGADRHRPVSSADSSVQSAICA
jgi:hypothetical protein